MFELFQSDSDVPDSADHLDGDLPFDPDASPQGADQMDFATGEVASDAAWQGGEQPGEVEHHTHADIAACVSPGPEPSLEEIILEAIWDVLVAPWVPEIPPCDLSQGLMSSSDFQSDGNYDPVHQCQVQGHVVDDMRHIHQQTHSSCSLMAQEQFVERYRGIEIPESELEALASSWGVYTPEGGTTFAGLDAVLDYYDVPHQRFTHTDADTLDQITSNGHDAIVSVDARYFYNDPTVPAGSGHAVAIVGKGIDPVTGQTKGYYFTDSNYPDTSRFLTVEELNGCWRHNLIAIAA